MFAAGTADRQAGNRVGVEDGQSLERLEHHVRCVQARRRVLCAIDPSARRRRYSPAGRRAGPGKEEKQAMEMKKLNAGNLRAAGYDEKTRTLVVELTSGRFEYAGVSSEVWRRLSTSSSPWSYFRDNIEDEYAARRVK